MSVYTQINIVNYHLNQTKKKIQREHREEQSRSINLLLSSPSLPNRAQHAILQAVELNKIYKRRSKQDGHSLLPPNLRFKITNFLKENCKNVQFSANKMPYLLKDRMDEIFLTPWRIQANESIDLIEFHNLISQNGDVQMDCPSELNLKTIITVSFKTENDMASWRDEASKERLEKIEQFKNFANNLWYFLNSKGQFIDYIDPSTGLPWFSPNYYTSIQETSMEFNDIENLSIEDLGCCKVISHKDFKSNVFVGTIVTSAEFDNDFFKELESCYES